MRIWHQSMTELDTVPAYTASLATRFESFTDADTEVVMHGMPPGTYGAASSIQVLPYPLERHRVEGVFLDLVQQAEREGFDAVMVAAFLEPAVREARSAVDIPVVSMAESCLLAGCAVAPRVGIVTVSPDLVRVIEDVIDTHHLGRRIAAVTSVTPAANMADLLRELDEPGHTGAAFEEACHAVIAAGADVIVPGEGILNELVVRMGLTEVDQVPIADALAVTTLHAEMLVRARAKAGLRTGRRWHYPRVPDDLRRVIDSPGSGS